MKLTSPLSIKETSSGIADLSTISGIKPGLPVKQLRCMILEWLDDGDMRGQSVSTQAIHLDILNKLLWFLGEPEIPKRRADGTVLSNDRIARIIHDAPIFLGGTELRQFLVYLRHGHKDPCGRWNNPSETSPVTPMTQYTYYRRLKTFFNWLVKQEYISISPMEKIDPPERKQDKPVPFTASQIDKLVEAAKTSRNPVRDEMIVWLLYDTGIRASELCGIRRCDIEEDLRRITVTGKGNKSRVIYYGRKVSRMILRYLNNIPMKEDDYVFQSGCGSKKGDKLTKDTLGLLWRRLCSSAGIVGKRKGPHNQRHTHSIEFLRAGGTAFALMDRLGHTSLTMTNVYVSLAESDIEEQRRFSPADRHRNKTE